MKNTPLKQETISNPFDHMPSTLILYHRNIQHDCKNRKKVQKKLAISLIDEVNAFLNLSKKNLVDSPNGMT